MARRSKMSQQKRQRELRKAEKAADKRAKRHGPSKEGPPVRSGTVLNEPGGASADTKSEAEQPQDEPNK